MKQQIVIPSGSSQLSEKPCCSTGKYYAYAATLSVYVYRSEDMQLERIINYPENTIICLAGCPRSDKDLAVFSSDGIIRVWNMESGNRLFSVETKGQKVERMTWDADDPNKIFCTTSVMCHVALVKEGTFQPLPVGDRLPKGSKLISFQQSTFQSNLLAIGYDCGEKHGATIFLHDTASKKTSKQNLTSAVVSMDWDPCSSDFILILLANGALLLYDITNGREVSAFTRQPVGSTKSAFFIGKSCPGSFLTCSARGDVLKLWNVAQTTFMKSLKVGIASDIKTATFVSSQNSYPKEARVMMTFKNGAVALYSPTKESLIWHTACGHTETVFACQFKVNNPNMLATSSYDRTIRIWDIGNQPEPSCAVVLPKLTSTIYSVSWSVDGSHIACGTGNGEVAIFDADKCLLNCKVEAHSEPCYCVEWNLSDGRLLASAGQDKKCVILTLDGEILQVIQHTSACYGVAWDPFNSYRLATTSDDMLFYLWTFVEPNNSHPFSSHIDELVSSTSFKVKKVNQFKGHKAKVFSVVWNCKIKDFVATASDDGTVRVWNLVQSSGSGREASGGKLPSGVLSGHKSRVRGLLWHKNAPWLLLSTSWDATVRLWDTVTMTCIQVMNCHHSDVYGISMHPQRPFVVATTSRDTTVRVWNLIGSSFDSLQHLPLSLWVKFLLNKGSEGQEDEKEGTLSMEFDMKVLESKFSKLGKDTALAGLDLLLNYWWPSSRANHLYEAAKIIMCSRSQSKTKAAVSEVADSHLNNLVKCVEGQSSQFVDILVQYENSHMVHSKVAYKVLQVEAQYLETFKKNRFMGVGMGKGKREVYTREAAKLYLRSGNVKRYCEIMCDLNEWDKALAVAPMIGQEYWKDLMKRKAKMCASTHHENKEDAFQNTTAKVQDSEAYFIAGQEIDALVNMYRGLKDNDSAFMVASVASEGGYGFESEDQGGDANVSPGSSPESSDVLFQPLRRKSLAPLTRPPGGALTTNPPASPGPLAQSHSQNMKPSSHANFRNAMYDIQTTRAQKFRIDGDPIAAACCRLSVSDVHGAINALMMGCEFELAAILSYYLLERDDPYSICAFRMQILKLEALQQYDLCSSLFEVFGYQGTAEEEIHKARKRVSLKNESSMNGSPEPSGVAGEMLALLREKKDSECAAKFAKHVEDTMRKPCWSMEEDIDSIWVYANCVNCDRIEVNLKKKFLCFLFTFSALKFMWKSQDSLCAHAFTVTEELLELPHISIPKEFEVSFKLQVLAYLAQSKESTLKSLGRKGLKAIDTKDLSEDLRKAVLQGVAEYDSSAYIPLPGTPDHHVIPTGSTLPSVERKQKGLFKTVLRASESIKLEDEISAISIGEAVMWQSVCSFSPLATGAMLKLS
ncbi:WD40 repeat domain-containing protein [Chloropicon primus]|uniref:WD40 repeat domain-containing protein n=1 Tax=Chloropicon primus TaxID=1764295 RepID=A0A5B8MN90_9CHLO|nr:WD40 repeat domain-containing protein [Chloropicon primus]UPR00973.1 WD40 repeat domain-containing protein [Chloropicon primus]|eukprot:QDZ21751.1 WD40 repeat domain-containing protein [Chloropicon primus]